jgi:hypothetical protein
VFVIPLIQAPRRGVTAKSIRMSLIMIGLVAAGLTACLFLAIVQLVRWIGNFEETFVNANFATWCGYVIAPLAVSWALWTLVIVRFSKRDPHANTLGRWLGILLGGTLIEVVIVLPLDIMVRRRTNCYCDTGTAHTLGFAAWALLWLAGPGAIFALTSKRRRLWWETHCIKCGYEKGPSPGERCPECAFEWATPAKCANPQAAHHQ